MSSYGHSLVPKHGVQVQKISNIGFFAPKQFIKGVDQTFNLMGSFVWLRY